MIDPDTKQIAIDTETTGVDETALPFQVSLCDQFGGQLLFEWEVDPLTRKPKIPKKDIKQIQKICKGKILVFHNRIFDITMLERVGCCLDWRNGKSLDTQILSHVYNSEVHSMYHGRLKELSLHYLDEWDDDQDTLRKAVSKARKVAKDFGWKLAEKKSSGKKDNDHLYQDYWLPRAVALHLNYEDDHPWYTLCADYANCDTERTMLLCLLFQGQIAKWKKDDPRHRMLQRENDLTPELFDMYHAGLSVFPQKIATEIAKFEGRIVPALVQIQKVVGSEDFNLNSPKQLQEQLFVKMKFPIIRRTESGSGSTDSNTRKALREFHESAKYKKSNKDLKKKRGLFLDSWDAYKDSISCRDFLIQYQNQCYGNHIYTQLVQCGAQTTRFSCRNHNVKKGDAEKGIEGLRNVYGPHHGRVWFCIDYSQLQLRIFAYLTEEQSMIDAFAAGYDFHGFVASKIFKKHIEKITSQERKVGKTVNFGYIFGESIKKTAIKTGVPDIGEILEKAFPSASRYMEITKRQVRSRGYVTTPHGYRLYTKFPHKGVNYIVQGCEGDIVKEAMILCGDYLKNEYSVKPYTGHMKFQIHDELIFDLPIKTPRRNRRIITDIVKLMEQPGKDIGMILPVDVERTETDWSKADKYQLTI